MDTANNSNNHIIGLFRPELASPERISETTVGRKQLLEDLLESLEKQVDKVKKQHYVFVGPRGIGKTHFLRLVEINIIRNAALNTNYDIVRFPEENYRILSFADFLLGIVEILGETLDDRWKVLFEKLEQVEDDAVIIDNIVPGLNKYKKSSDKNLIVLLENLDMIFREQLTLKKNEKSVHQFRKFLMETPCVNFIGTSPVHFEGFDDANYPLYDFFDIQTLEEFTEKQTIELIKSNLEWDGKKDLLNNFDDMAPKILALHEMTGGNARLIMMLYNLIAQDNILEVKKQFEILLDRISPFYQDRIKDLAPQERALLETMAIMRREFKTPAKVALKMRKSQQQISSLLKRMLKSGYLTVSNHPQDRRSKVYRIKEGFFDLWLAMSQSRVQRKRLPYLVDFFAGWYAQKDEREKKRQELWEIIEKDKHKAENSIQILDYLSEVGTTEEKTQAKLEQVVHSIKCEDPDRADSILSEIRQINTDDRVITWMKDQTNNWIVEQETHPDILEQMEQIVDFWRFQRSGDLEERAAMAVKLGTDFSRKGLHELNIAFLQQEIANINDPNQQIEVLKKIADSQMALWKLKDASLTLEKALSIFNDNNNRSEKRIVLNQLAISEYQTGNYEQALYYLEGSLGIHQEIGDKSGESATLNNISQIYQARGDYEAALRYLEESLQIRQEIGDRSGKGVTLNSMSAVSYARGDYETALRYLEESLRISQEVGDKRGEGTTLNNISQIYTVRGEYETALRYLEESLQINQEIGDKKGEGTTLNNIGQIYDARNDYETALRYLEKSLRISQEIGDKSGESTTLNNISQIYKARGDYETALRYLEESLQISQEIGDKSVIIATLHNMSQIALENDQNESAYTYAEKAYNLAIQTGNALGIYHVGGHLGLLLCHMGNTEKGIDLLKQSLEIGKSTGLKGYEKIPSLIQQYSSS